MIPPTPVPRPGEAIPAAQLRRPNERPGRKIRLVRAEGWAPPGAAPYPMGLVVLLSAVGLLFAAFTAALLVRRQGVDWTPFPLPWIVWLNAGILTGSSLFMEGARRAGRRGDGDRTVGWLRGAALFGLLFLAGQAGAWILLARHGLFLLANPHAAFFYTLSALHAAHVGGGLGAVGSTVRRISQGADGPFRRGGVNYVAVYWHFVGGVWLALLTALATL